MDSVIRRNLGDLNNLGSENMYCEASSVVVVVWKAPLTLGELAYESGVQIYCFVESLNDAQYIITVVELTEHMDMRCI